MLSILVDILSLKTYPPEHVIPNPRNFCGVRDLLFGFQGIRVQDFNRAR